jgi:hypothetical protein
VVSHRPKQQHVCPNTLTSEPSLRRQPTRASSALSSKRWQGRKWAGRCEKRREPYGKGLGSNRECKRGITGPLLPPKDNPSSQCSGCEPRRPAWKAGGHTIATRPLYIGLTAGFTRCTCNVSGPGKTCRVFLRVISAKDVANTSRQDVTLLCKLYLTF